jgi:hypothetical protein
VWWLYLDESGDLGFDFVNKRPSKFFTICILATSDRNSFVHLSKAVKVTIRRKMAKGVVELKGKNTSLKTKEYFFEKIRREQFGIYSVTLNKRKVYNYLTTDKERVYNWIARLVLQQIPWENARERVQLIVDKCKGKPEIVEFNNYVIRQVKSRFDPSVPLNIDHLCSSDDKVLQAADLFAWGIFRKYENRDLSWYNVFQEKVNYDHLYLS